MNCLAPFWHAVATVFELPRRLDGPRFFDAITVGAWHTKGRFLLAVQKLGWGVVTVRKQARLEVYQQSEALRREHPRQRWFWEATYSSRTCSPAMNLVGRGSCRAWSRS